MLSRPGPLPSGPGWTSNDGFTGKRDQDHGRGARRTLELALNQSASLPGLLRESPEKHVSEFEHEADFVDSAVLRPAREVEDKDDEQNDRRLPVRRGVLPSLAVSLSEMTGVRGALCLGPHSFSSSAPARLRRYYQAAISPAAPRSRDLTKSRSRLPALVVASGQNAQATSAHSVHARRASYGPLAGGTDGLPRTGDARRELRRNTDYGRRESEIAEMRRIGRSDRSRAF